MIDTSTYVSLLRDGQVPELESGPLPASEWGPPPLVRPVVKGFNNRYAAHLENAGPPGRIARPVAGDEAAAQQQVLALVKELGFDAGDDGRLWKSWRPQSGPPVSGTRAV